MEKMIELKAKAYDVLAKMEYHQAEAQKCKDELASINAEIKKEFEAQSEAPLQVEEVN
jgi:hypothetical protein